MDQQSNRQPQAFPEPGIDDFGATLAKHGLTLTRASSRALQINVGLLCDLACRHCHLEAGPSRHEVMTRETMAEVIAYAGRARFEQIDITGGAPELVPHIEWLLTELAPLAPRVLFRTNLSALGRPESRALVEVLRQQRCVIVASFPSCNTGQAESQRGIDYMGKGVATLKMLNQLGFGVDGNNLELDLVVNPTGAFLPPAQCQTEQKFRQDLLRKHGIVFSHLYTFANVPLGRFRHWLESSGNLENYLKKLAGSFNPATVQGLMCRSLVSVSWDGYLFDCDFNLAIGQPLEGRKRHVAEMAGHPPIGIPIPTGDYCYACTAGSGFT
ncbi:radical SAM/Cys-rich domain protein [Geotalea uraniireducens]|uniref:Radical SAM/Cys-rich domain protein n=1 Tax=Geotalea uraniireducens TaxID=351604 RepID=A0ABN6VTA5_9BACT|nr:arsenosugar biosynthesis radical SAM (seleno)protein ArsS [Geotalea uraniireducens]BDV42365.1 radical SAM/Cys-rich domain protein [Geotalea uraniireducens]